MVNEVIQNAFLVNAPAGSGKTTRIKSMIIDHLLKEPNDYILCITYTNRAAEELNKDIESTNVQIGTIHSFLHSFIQIYFKHQEILELYFEIYGDDIQLRIQNLDDSEHITKSNEKYIEKFSTLDFDTVKRNLISLYYNEASYNSLYYGGLSHNDLISFAKRMFDKFPIIKRRISQKFQVIFIDEYQDSSAEVLKMFVEAVKGTSTKLYFLGDKMQQIYKNYDGSFETELTMLNKSISLCTNHRSIRAIIDILNNIYNDSDFKQNPSPKNQSIAADHPPRVLICNDIDPVLESEKAKYPNALKLFLLNQKRFDSIGSGNLYRQISSMERYSFSKQFGAVDILTNNTPENPDPLIKLLFFLHQISCYHTCNDIGSVVQLLRKNSKVFAENINIKCHEDKVRLCTSLKKLLDIYNATGGSYTIQQTIETAIDSGLTLADYFEQIKATTEYDNVLEVKICEFRSVAKYLENPTVSTQHGVKGESHDTVFFIAENSSNPNVQMYNFFDLWTNNDISLSMFDSFYYQYCLDIQQIHSQLGYKVSDIDKGIYETANSYLIQKSHEIIDKYKDNSIFNHLCLNSYEDFLAKPGVTKVKKCFKESPVYGALSAYRLFYVGCSRARRNLTIFLDKSKLQGDDLSFINKLESTGFTVSIV